MIGFFRNLRRWEATQNAKLDVCISSIEGLVSSVKDNRSVVDASLVDIDSKHTKSLASTTNKISQLGDDMLFFSNETKRQLEQHRSQIDLLLRTIQDHTVLLNSLESRCLPREQSELVQALRKENIELKKRLAALEVKDAST